MNQVRKISDADICEAKGCDNKASAMAYSRNKRKVIICCSGCTYLILEENNPEYHDSCANCGCELPIN